MAKLHASTLVTVAVAAVISTAMPVAAGVPAPPVLEVNIQPFIAVSAAPTVSYAPDYPLDVFQYRGRYYAWQNGWFVTERPGQPWTYVQQAQVPQAVLLVPAKYYKKVPPGHAKNRYRHHPHQHERHHHDDDD